jgi:preprotein translocase subunit SecA
MKARSTTVTDDVRAALYAILQLESGRVLVIGTSDPLRHVGHASAMALKEQLKTMEKMKQSEQRQPRRTSKPLTAVRRPGRNELCPCCSGRKYKRCCLGKALPTF